MWSWARQGLCCVELGFNFILGVELRKLKDFCKSRRAGCCNLQNLLNGETKAGTT